MEGILGNLPDVALFQLLCYLDRDDIAACKMVNKHLNNFFKCNKALKRLLYYEEKYYLSLMSGDEVDTCRGNNLKYLKLQWSHLKKWTDGEFFSYKQINVSPTSIVSMGEIFDDDLIHWVVFSDGYSIKAWASPRPDQPVMQAETNIGRHTRMHLLPHGRVLVTKIDTGMMAVYEFQSSTLAFRLQYSFDFHGEKVEANEFSSVSTVVSPNMYYVLVEDHSIGYSHNVFSGQDSILYIWNLSSGVKNTFNLSRCSEVQDFGEFLKSENENRAHENCINIDSFHYLLELYPCDFPNVVVVLTHKLLRISQVCVFNIKRVQFTHLVARVYSKVIACSMFNDTVAVHRGSPEKNQVSFYGLSFESSVARKVYSESTFDSHIIFKSSKVLIHEGSCVRVLSIRPDKQWPKQVSVGISLKMLGFLEPKFLLMYDDTLPPNNNRVVLFNVIKDEEVYSWENININFDRFHEYFTNLKYPLALVLADVDLNCFQVYKVPVPTIGNDPL